LPMQAVVHDTPPAYTSPWVLPGRYTVKLSVNGQTYTQPLVIRMDPRVKTPLAGLGEQYRISKQLYDGMVETSTMLSQMQGLKDQIHQRKSQTAQAAAGEALDAFEKQLEALEGQQQNRLAALRGGASPRASVTLVRFQLAGLLNMVQQADVAPTAAQIAAAGQLGESLAKLAARWNTLKTAGLARLNAALQAVHLAPVTVPASRM